MPTPVPADELHHKARQLSDHYTPTLGTRSLDLLHIAAALKHRFIEHDGVLERMLPRRRLR